MFRVLTLALVLVCNRGLCDDQVTESPQKTFKIVQQYRAPVGQENGGHHRQILFFSDGRPGIVLEDDVMWPAFYEISTDERWIFRTQKVGSGDNISYLYQVDKNRRVWRMEEQIGELALAFLARTSGVVPQELDHTGVEFTSWDMQAGLLHFTVSGSSTKESGKGVKRALAYKLDEQKIVNP